MVGSMFALILGLALLGLAVWLLLRAKDRDAANGTDEYGGGNADGAADWSPDEDYEWSESEEDGEWSVADDEEWSAGWDGPQFDSWFGDDYESGEDSDYEDDADEYQADSAGDGLGESPAEDWAEEPSEDWPDDEPAEGEESDVTPTPAAVPASGPASAMAAFGFPRRRRRQWAADNGFEYTKEDVEVARAWPIAITGDHQRGGPTLREVVSGFVDGHQVHIGDLGSSTLMAMRRVEESPVQVLYSSGGAQPAGMRRTDLLDQPPFAAYTTDVLSLIHI